jgi:hypothetical protein
MKPFQLSVAALVLPLALAACSNGGDPVAQIDEGFAALNSGDAANAHDHFLEAVGELEPSDPNLDRAQMGLVEAKIRIQPEAAAKYFLDYAEKQPGNVDAGDYQKVGMQLTDKKALKDAVFVLDAGLKRFEGDAKLKEAMDKTKLAAESSGDAGALDALKGLGYVGD